MGEPAGAQIGDMQDPRIYTAFENGLSTGDFTPADRAFFASAGPAPLLGSIHIPVLLMQGTDDTLFSLHEAIANYQTLKASGDPVQMLWFCGSLTDNPGVAHGQCLTPKGPDPALTLHFELRWLARYLKGETGVDTGPGFTWISDAGVERTTAAYPPAHGPAVTGSGAGTLPLLAGDTSGELIAAGRAVSAVNVPLKTPASGTEMLGEPSLTLSYSGTAANPDGRIYAQIVSDGTGLVLGNQVTPIPVTLDGQSHKLTLPLEAVAADVGSGSTYTLQITDGTDVYFAARSAGLVNLSQISVSVPTVAAGASRAVRGPKPTGPASPPPPAAPVKRFSCAAPSGRLAGRSLGPVALGMARAHTRSLFDRVSLRGRRYMDFFCPAHGGVRVGYATPALLGALSGRERRQVRGRVVLVLTANRHYALRGVRPGSRLAAARARLRLDRGFQIGVNHWYLVPAGRAQGVLKVRHGQVQEVGIANPALTGRRLARRFLGRFS
jgi:hypothetical protein